MSKPSPALVLSILAIFVALGGTGYAAVQIPRSSVGAKQLKKNAVSSAKVKNGALLLLDFKASERTRLRGAAGARGAAGTRGLAGTQGIRGAVGVQGLQGDPGTQGVPGAQGDPGDPGAQGNTGVEQVIVRTTGFLFALGTGDGVTQSDDVQCQPGESVVGGGTDVSPGSLSANQPNTFVTISRPSDANGDSPAGGSTPTGWFAAARRNDDVFIQTVTVYVLCASSA